MAKSDIEIAREAKIRPITEIGDKLSIPADALMQYGPTKAKISFDYLESIKKNKDG
jgi:formate--tetrahydrofolate ligase